MGLLQACVLCWGTIPLASRFTIVQTSSSHSCPSDVAPLPATPIPPPMPLPMPTAASELLSTLSQPPPVGTHPCGARPRPLWLLPHRTRRAQSPPTYLGHDRRRPRPPRHHRHSCCLERSRSHLLRALGLPASQFPFSRDMLATPPPALTLFSEPDFAAGIAPDGTMTRLRSPEPPPTLRPTAPRACSRPIFRSSTLTCLPIFFHLTAMSLSLIEFIDSQLLLLPTAATPSGLTTS